MNDWSIAHDLCEDQEHEADQLLPIASKIVRRLAPFIYKLAEELLNRGRLTYEEVIDLCPEVSAEGEARFSPSSGEWLR